MTLCSNLFLNSRVTIFVLTALMLFLCLSSPYFSNQYIMIARSAIPNIVGGHTIAPRKNIKLVQPGEAFISFDASSLIAHVDMTISTRALGNSIGSSKLESIAKHEIGHALGIGHTDFVGDLMSPVLTGRTDTSISVCDISGIEQANQWKDNLD